MWNLLRWVWASQDELISVGQELTFGASENAWDLNLFSHLEWLQVVKVIPEFADLLIEEAMRGTENPLSPQLCYWDDGRFHISDLCPARNICQGVKRILRKNEIKCLLLYSSKAVRLEFKFFPSQPVLPPLYPPKMSTITNKEADRNALHCVFLWKRVSICWTDCPKIHFMSKRQSSCLGAWEYSGVLLLTNLGKLVPVLPLLF